jgi:hypothetical protein
VVAGRGGDASRLRSEATADWVRDSPSSSRVRWPAMSVLRRSIVGAASTWLTSSTGMSRARHAAADLRRGDLSRRVVAVAGVRVDVSRLEEADAVVVAQRLHAQVCRPGELAGGQ